MTMGGVQRIKGMILCLFLSIFWAAPVLTAQEEDGRIFEKKGMDSLKKSLFVPGWGQLAERHTLEGIAFLAADVFCLYEVLRNNHKGNVNYDLYEQAGSVEDAVIYRELTETFDRRRNLYLLAAVGVWAVNLIDIYVIVTNNEKKKDTISIKIEHGENKSLAITFSCSF